MELEELKQKIKSQLGKELIEETKIDFLHKLVETAVNEDISVTDVVYMLCSQVDMKLCWQLSNHKDFTKKNAKRLSDKKLIVNNVNKHIEYDDLILSEKGVIITEKLLGFSYSDNLELAEEFIEIYPSEHIGDKRLFLKKISNRDLLCRNYVKSITKEAEKSNKLVIDYHKEVIEKIKQNKSSINVNINSFVEGMNWKDLKIQVVKQSKNDI